MTFLRPLHVQLVAKPVPFLFSLLELVLKLLVLGGEQLDLLTQRCILSLAIVRLAVVVVEEEEGGGGLLVVRGKDTFLLSRLLPYGEHTLGGANGGGGGGGGRGVAHHAQGAKTIVIIVIHIPEWRVTLNVQGIVRDSTITKDC